MADGRADEEMKVSLIYPIGDAHGTISNRQYIRTMANGQKIIARKPNRQGHIKTEQEAANQRRFAARYARGSK